MRFVAVLVIAVALAGCLTAPPAGDGASGSEQAIVDRRVNATWDREASVDPVVGQGRQAVDVGWNGSLPGVVEEMTVRLAWSQDGNAFGLRVDVDGTEHEIDPPDRTEPNQVEGTVRNLSGGPYTFTPVADGPTSFDVLTLTVDATFVVPLPESADVGVRRSSDGWQVTLRSTVSQPIGDEARVALETGNGNLQLGDEGNRASVDVTASGTGATLAKAVERARSIDVTARIADGRVEGRGRADEWHDRRAHVEAQVPASADVGAATGNGHVDLDHDRLGTVDVGTGNGQLTGSVHVAEALSASTGNGGADLDVTPTGDLEIDVASGNGALSLGLTEGPDIAYEVGASTGNGEITASMEEAELEGSSNDATLRTVGGDGRDHQVTGSVSSGNGDIDFQGR